MDKHSAAPSDPTPAKPLDPNCAMARALELIANKWTVPVFYVLSRAGSPVRFRELQRRVGAITQKELTRHLRRLEAAGIVERTLYAEVPPRVEYALTPLGQTLVGPLSALGRWAFENAPAVEANEQAYAAKNAPPRVARGA